MQPSLAQFDSHKGLCATVQLCHSICLLVWIWCARLFCRRMLNPLVHFWSPLATYLNAWVEREWVGCVFSCSLLIHYSWCRFGAVPNCSLLCEWASERRTRRVSLDQCVYIRHRSGPRSVCIAFNKLLWPWQIFQSVLLWRSVCRATIAVRFGRH